MLAIALGDPTGIGPEVALKAVAAELPRDAERYLFIGDEQLVRDLNERLGLNLPIATFAPHEPEGRLSSRPVRHGGWKAAAPVHGPKAGPTLEVEAPHETARCAIVSPLPPLASKLSAGEPAAARAALAWLKHGAQLCLKGEASALITAPVNKEAIIRSGETPFVGQTELLSELAGANRTAMMLLGTDERGRWLRVALATIHIPIREVSARLTREKVELAIELAAQACRDLALPRAKIAVCGLNPHAGEGGKIGDEEITTVSPAVATMRQRGFDVHGPFAADALFYYVLRGDYDAVVAAYHDQGLVPLKMVAFETGVNWTLGLPFIRTSPDHGTAYDIAGRGLANPSSTIAAIRLAKQLLQNRAASERGHPVRESN